MKQNVKYQSLIIPGKLRLEVRISVDERNAEYQSTFEGNKSTGINFLPIVSLNIIRPTEVDENGQRVKARFNPNDNLGMTKYNIGLFTTELGGMINDLKTPELYEYHGKRLELNEAVAEKVRRPFMIGNITVELSAVVIIKADDTRVEGVKLKFNNEQSSVLLTLNELNALHFTLDHLDVDSIALLMYLNYVEKPNHPTSFNEVLPEVDIKPKEFEE